MILNLPLHIFLALAALGVVAVVILQDYLVPALRHESISAGLTGPYHWYLDASYVALSVALVLAFHHATFLAQVLSIISAATLLLTAITNTFGNFVDTFTHGQHALWHSRFTAAVFASALGLQFAIDHSVWQWTFTAVNLGAPAVIYLLSGSSPYTEKVGVLVLCLWLVAV